MIAAQNIAPRARARGHDALDPTDSMSLTGGHFIEQELLLAVPKDSEVMVDVASRQTRPTPGLKHQLAARLQEVQRNRLEASAFGVVAGKASASWQAATPLQPLLASANHDTSAQPQPPSLCLEAGKASASLQAASPVQPFLDSAKDDASAPQHSYWPEAPAVPASTEALPTSQPTGLVLPRLLGAANDTFGLESCKESTSSPCDSDTVLLACSRRPTKTVTSLTQWYDDSFSNAGTPKTASPGSTSEEGSTYSAANLHDPIGSSTEVFFLFDPSTFEESGFDEAAKHSEPLSPAGM
jgi:hypothetical protein